MQRITISMLNSDTNHQIEQQPQSSPTSINSTYNQYHRTVLETPITPNTEILNNVIDSLRQVNLEGSTQYMDTGTDSVGALTNWNVNSGHNTQPNTWSTTEILTDFPKHNNDMYHQHLQSNYNTWVDSFNGEQSSSNNVHHNVEVNNLFSLFDAHRKIILNDTMRVEEVPIASHSCTLDSINMDNRSLIESCGENNIFRNEDTQNQISINSHQNSGDNNTCNIHQHNEGLIRISQALQTLKSMSYSDQEQLSHVVWKAILNQTNSTSDLTSAGGTSTISNSGTSAFSSKNHEHGEYKMFDSFEEDHIKGRPLCFSQHVKALTLHKMEEQITTPFHVTQHSSKFKKFNSHPIINIPAGSNPLTNIQNELILSNIHQQSDNNSIAYMDVSDENSLISSCLTPLDSQLTLDSGSQQSRRSSLRDMNHSLNCTPIPSTSSETVLITAPAATPCLINLSPKSTSNTNQPPPTAQKHNSQHHSKRRISSSSLSSSTHNINSIPNNYTSIAHNNVNNHILADICNNNTLAPTGYSPHQQCCEMGSVCINFSLPGVCESASGAVKQFGKKNQSKKYSNNNFSESGLSISENHTSTCVVCPHSTSHHCSSSNSTNNHQKITSPSSPLPEKPSNSRVNNNNISSTKDCVSANNHSGSSASPTVNKFQHSTLSGTGLVKPSTNFQHHHTTPELSISHCTESNLDTIPIHQYLNNISTDYTMSSHSPISSSNSNEQNGQGKQYQGVMDVNAPSWGVKVNRKYRQLRKSLKTCKHFEDNYFVLELNGQGGAPGNSNGQGQGQPKPKPKPKAKSQPHVDDKKPSIPIPYKEQVNMMGEFSVAKSIDDEVLPLSILNREEHDLYLTTPNSTSSASSKSSSIKDLTKKKRKNSSQEPTRKNRKKETEPQQEIGHNLGGFDSTIYNNNDILPSINRSVNMAPLPSLENTEIMNFSKGVPDMMCYQPNSYQIPSLISPQKSLDYRSTTTTPTFNYENSTTTNPNTITFENNTTSSSHQVNQTENRNPFSSGFPSNNSFGLFSTNEDFTTMKLPSNNSIDSFFKADLTDEKTTTMPRNMSSSSDFLPLEEATYHHPPVSHPIVNNYPTTTTQVKIIPPKLNITEPKKEIERNQLTRCMSHASLSMLDEEEEEEPEPIKIPPISIQEPQERYQPPKEAKENIKSKSPLITPLNAVLYKNISVSNMDLVNLDVPSASILRPIQSESEMVEKDHAHWINEIKTLPSTDSLANMLDFDILSETKKH